MNVLCETREERIAIRIESGMTEAAAIALTDAESQSKSMFKRVAEMARHQREHAAPVALTVPASEPRLTAKDMAAGETI